MTHGTNLPLCVIQCELPVCNPRNRPSIGLCACMGVACAAWLFVCGELPMHDICMPFMLSACCASCGRWACVWLRDLARGASVCAHNALNAVHIKAPAIEGTGCACMQPGHRAQLVAHS